MTTKATVASRFHLRRGLAEPEAALYLGLGASKFRQMVNEGRLPRAIRIDRRAVWDIRDLDSAFDALRDEQVNLEPSLAADGGWGDETP